MSLARQRLNADATNLSDRFFCAMVAAITLKFLDPFGSGKLVLFQVTYDKVCFSLRLGNAFAHHLPIRIGTHMNSFRSSSWASLEYVEASLECKKGLLIIVRRAYSAHTSPS